MKIMIITGLLLLYGCGLSNMDEPMDFIPGVYARFSQHEFGSEYDTLVITLRHKDASEYNIIRKWKYERVLDGVVIEPEYKRSVTTGIYDSKMRLLRLAPGESFSFDVRRKVLYNGHLNYQKL